MDSSERRGWMFRIAAAVGIPLAVLVVIELVLRLAGYGCPASFALLLEKNGEKVLVQNDRFAWRFIDPLLARGPVPFAVPRTKAPVTYRIFVLGGSAAQGDPDTVYGFARMVKVMLETRYPDMNFEVINAAITAVNSHVVREIAKECEKYDPDLFVLYLGNNEVVGPFGAGTVFGAQAPPMALIRLNLFLTRFRTGQLISSMVRRVRGAPGKLKSWEGMAMFEDRQVPAEDPRLSIVYRHFRENLESVIASADRSDIPLILGTVAVNLRDSPPFGSLHRPDLTPAERKRWESLISSAVTSESAGDCGEALAAYRQAAALDDRYADLHYRKAKCLKSFGQPEAASESFRKARDLDTLRFRADSRINAILRDLSGAEGVRLFDAEAQFGREKGLESPDSEYFLDHVHFTFAGNYRMARWIVESVDPFLRERRGPAAGGGQPIPSVEGMRERLAFTGLSRLKLAEAMLGLKARPPFTRQIGNESELQALKEEITGLRSSLTSEVKERIKARYEALILRFPDDWELRFKFSSLLMEGLSEHEEAVFHLERVLELVPRMPRAEANLGLAYATKGDYQSALTRLRHAVTLDPGLLGARNNIGNVYLAMGRTKEARREFEEILDLNPDHPAAHLNLGEIYFARGEMAKAARHYSRVITLDPENDDARAKLEKARGKAGGVEKP